MNGRLCVIPARGGSKRFPRKNITTLFGKPLIAYVIEAAIKSKMFDKVVVSTEDKEIASISREYGAEMIDRPDELSTDTARAADVCVDVIERMEKSGQQYDTICMLFASSPLTTHDDIVNAVKKYDKSDAHFLISTTDYRYSPFRALKESNEGYLEPFFDSKYLRRDQDNPVVMVANGCIAIAKVQKFKEYKSFYGKKAIPFKMDFQSSIDINEPVDLKIAEYFLGLRDME